MYQCMCVIQELADLGTSPSIDEIRHEMCLANPGGAHRILILLRERGYIDWLPCQSRSITILRRVQMPDDFNFRLTLEALPALLEGPR